MQHGVNIGDGKQSSSEKFCKNSNKFYGSSLRVLVTSSLSGAWKAIANKGFYTGSSSGNIQKWTHPKIVQNFNASATKNKNNMDASRIGFNRNTDAYFRVFLPWLNFSMLKSYIAPAGNNISHDHGAVIPLTFSVNVGLLIGATIDRTKQH